MLGRGYRYLQMVLPYAVPGLVAAATAGGFYPRRQRPRTVANRGPACFHRGSLQRYHRLRTDGDADDRNLIQPEIVDDPNTVAVRPKLLSKEAEQTLRSIENALRGAKQLKRKDEVAGTLGQEVVTQ